MLYFFFFLIGIDLGSLVGFLASRVVANESLFKLRSRCGSCDRPVEWYDLVPLFSFIYLKGKCRNCNNPIPLFHFIVELVFGLAMIAVFSRFGLSLLTPIYTIFFLLLMLNSLTDYLNYTVYNIFLYPLVLASLLVAYVSGDIFYYVLQGLLFVVGLFLIAKGLQFFLKKETVGSGDYFVVFAIAVLVEYQQFIHIILVSSLIGIFIGLIFRKQRLPFITLLTVGYLIFFLKDIIIK